MANTTSGTATFDKTFAIDEIVEESFERIGLQNVAGYQLKSARRSLNILFQEWGNRGIHYWEIADLNIDLLKDNQIMIFLDHLTMAQVQHLHQLAVYTECLMF